MKGNKEYQMEIERINKELINEMKNRRRRTKKAGIMKEKESTRKDRQQREPMEEKREKKERK